MSEEIASILDCYSELLSPDDLSLITFACTIRGSLSKELLEELPLIKEGPDSSIMLVNQSTQDRDLVIERLVTHNILIPDSSAQSYSIHPLIRSYYQKRLEKNATLTKLVHQHLFQYYNISIEKIASVYDLTPLIEAVHHACKCGLYPVAWDIYIKKINVPGINMLTDRFGAYDTALSIMREFFPRGDLEEKPILNSNEQVSQLLSNVGYYLMSLGYLGNALSAFKKGNDIDRKARYNIKVSNEYQNLSRLYSYMGDLKSATEMARKGIKAAKRTRADYRKITRHRINSMCLLAWSFHLRGYRDASRQLFQDASKLNSDIVKKDILTKFRGFFYASHLMMTGYLLEARVIAESNLAISQNLQGGGELAQISRWHRLLGDLDAAENNDSSALEHYDSALKVARNIFRKEILIEALISRGRFTAKNMANKRAAYVDLSEALKYATDCGYRIYEVDIRNALARTFLADGNVIDSSNEILYARQVSRSLGYYWGNEEVIELTPKLAFEWNNIGFSLSHKALQDYRKAIKIDPQIAEAWNNKSISLSHEALQYYRKAVEDNPQDAEACNTMGYALYKLGKYDESIESFDNAIKNKPQFAGARYNKCIALSHEALWAYNKAIEIFPQDASAWYNKGVALKALCRTTEADAAITKAKELGYEG